MKTTLTERVTVLETGFKLTVGAIKEDVQDIKTDVNKISLEMPEMLRRVDAHHKVFPKHVQMIDALEKANCPIGRTTPDNNRKHNGRKLDQKKYKIMIWTAIIGSSATLLALLGWLGSVLIAAGQVLESIPK